MNDGGTIVDVYFIYGAIFFCVCISDFFFSLEIFLRHFLLINVCFLRNTLRPGILLLPEIC